MLILLLALLKPPTDVPPVADVPPVKAGSWVAPKNHGGTELPVKHPWDVVHDRVTAGETVWVSVGEDYPDAVRIDNPPDGVGRGVFKCFREGGRNVISKLVRPVETVRSLVPQFAPVFRPTCPGGNCPQTQPLYYSR